jgi:peptide subunit release factor 1 (eRF1)
VFISTALEQIHPNEEDLHEAIAPALKDLPEGTGMRITDAIVTRAHQTGARVKFIEDAALLRDIGGVGASLRYRL